MMTAFVRRTPSVFVAVAVSTLVMSGSARANEPVDPTPPRGVTACSDAGWHYRTYSPSKIHIGTGLDFKNGPGGHVEATRQTNLTAATKISLGVEASVSSVVASAKASFGYDVTSTASQGETWGYGHDISPAHYGHLQFGNWGWRMNVEKYYMDASCRLTKSYTGTVPQMPSAKTWGYRYWETNR